MKTFFLTVCILSGFFSFSQTKKTDFIEIRGKIRDGETKKAIQGAQLLIHQQSIFVFSNENGEFILRIPSIGILKDSLMILKYGYAKVATTVEKIRKSPTIDLVPALGFTHRLPPTKGIDLVKRALEAINENSNEEVYQFSGFFQESMKRDSHYIKLVEAYVRAEKKGELYKFRVEDEEIERVKLLKGRQTQLPKAEVYDKFGVKQPIILSTRSIDTVLPEYLKTSNLKNYNFVLKPEYVSYDNKNLYAIAFTPVSKKIKLAREGTILIDTATYAIVHIDYKMLPGSVSEIIQTNISDIFSKVKIIPTGLSTSQDYILHKKKWILGETNFKVEGIEKTKKDTLAKFFVEYHYVTTEFIRKNILISDEDVIKENLIIDFQKGVFSPEWWGGTNMYLPTDEKKSMREE